MKEFVVCLLVAPDWHNTHARENDDGCTKQCIFLFMRFREPCLPPAAGVSFTQPLREKYALQRTFV